MAWREAVRPPADQEVPATSPDGAAARDRSPQPCLPQGWSGSSKHPPPAGGQRRLVGRSCRLHAGGEEQGKSRAARRAGIQLAERLDPVRQLTRVDECDIEYLNPDRSPSEETATCTYIRIDTQYPMSDKQSRYQTILKLARLLKVEIKDKIA